MTIRRLHHVQITIASNAEEAARAFYCQVLGLQEIPKPASLQHRGGFWVSLGGQQIHIGLQNDVNRQALKSHLAYEVDDLKMWRSKLSGVGIAITESIPIPGYERFECRDPFGNRIEFIQPTS